MSLGRSAPADRMVHCVALPAELRPLLPCKGNGKPVADKDEMRGKIHVMSPQGWLARACPSRSARGRAASASFGSAPERPIRTPRPAHPAGISRRAGTRADRGRPGSQAAARVAVPARVGKPITPRRLGRPIRILWNTTLKGSVGEVSTTFDCSLRGGGGRRPFSFRIARDADRHSVLGRPYKREEILCRTIKLRHMRY